MNEQMTFSADELERLNNLALAVFSARTFSQMADVVLERLSGLVACEKSFLTREPNPGGSRRRLMRTLTMTADELDQYERRFAALDYSAWFLEQEGAAAYRDSDLVSEEAMRRSAIFTEWVQPMGMRYVGGAVMHDRGVRRTSRSSGARSTATSQIASCSCSRWWRGRWSGGWSWSGRLRRRLARSPTPRPTSRFSPSASLRWRALHARA